MSTTGILRPDEVVFYHPLNNLTEHTQSQAWTGTGEFPAGKVASGLGGASNLDAFDTKVVFSDPSTASDIYLARLSATAFVAAWRDGTGGKGVVNIGLVSGTVITFGAKIVFDTGISNDINVAALSATTIAVAWREAGSKGVVIIGTVSGTDVTFGTETVFNAASSQVIDIDMLSSTTFVATYKDAGNSDFGTAIIGTVSGTDVTFGAEAVFNAGVTSAASAAGLSSTALVVAYVDVDNSDFGTAIIGTVSGTDVTFGAERVFNASTTAFNSIVVDSLSSTTFVVAYRKGVAFNLSAAIFGTVSGTDMTFGAETVFNASASFITVAKLSLTTFVISYRDGVGNLGTSIIGSVSGTDLTFGDEVPLTGENLDHINCTSLSPTTFVVGYRDLPNSNFGSAIIGIVASAASLTASTPAAYPDATGNDRIVMAMWANKLGGDSSAVTVERDFTVAFTATTIALGPATATWSDAGITSLMSTMSAGEHFLVLDFEHTGAGSWTLKTSIDGAAFVAQGAQDSGTRDTSPASLAPRLSIDDASGQWIDELVMWSGDKSSFASFETQELANLFDLADTFGEPMSQFEENFGAPLCWQATARMPDGSVWRDSGSGPCPPVVRVPNGAEDIVVTDDGSMVSPRIIEG